MSRTQQRRPAPRVVEKKQNPAYLWVSLGLIGLVALVVAMIVSGGSSQDPGMPTDASVAITGDNLPTFAGDPNLDPAVGLTAPALVGEDFTGNTVSIVDDGRPKVILFLAHWCPHCQREVPALRAYAEEVGLPDNVDLYSVATSYSATQPNWPPSAWLAREGWSFPVIVDDPASRAFLAFGRGGFPFYVFVDAHGNVAMRLSGEQDPANLAAMMEALARN